MVEFGREENITKEINNSIKLLRLEKDISRRLALCNYIGNLYSALSVIRGRDVYPNKIKVFGSSVNFRKFIKTTNFLRDRFNNNFIFYKDFHQKYLNSILVEIEDSFIDLIDEKIASNNQESDFFGKNDFCSIFFDFCRSLSLEKLADEILKEEKIFCMMKGEGVDDYLGINLHNPIIGNSNILIHNFDYDLNTLFTLAHEAGHYYDTSEFNFSKVNKYNSYIYSSIYQEVISKLFERLLLNFLIKNNIMREKAKDKLFDLELINHQDIICAYVLSLLDDKYLKKEKYRNLSNKRLYKLVNSGFINIDELEISVEDLNLCDNLYYSYGAIISLFLEEAVIEEGFNSLLIKKFNNIRWREFTKQFIEKEGLTSSKFAKIYRKELQVLY